MPPNFTLSTPVGIATDVTANPPDSYIVDGIAPSRAARPSTLEELSSALRDAHEEGAHVIPWGGGTRMHVGNLPDAYDLALDVTGLDRIVEYEPADLTVVVESGVRVAELQATLAKSGQRLAFDPPFPERATIGGSLASNAVGPLRSGFGGVRDLTIGLTVVEADGAVTRSGGRVVKNVQGFDLVRLHIGALGTLGVIAEAAFKLAPLPARSRTVAAWFDSLEGVREAAMQIYNGPAAPEALSVVAGARAARFVEAITTQAGQTAEADYLLLVRLSGGPAAVRRQVDDATATAGGAMASGTEVFDGAESDGAWALTQPATESPPRVSARVTLKPTGAFELIARLQRASSRGPAALETVLHVGTGTLIADWTGREDEILDPSQVIAMAFSEARSCGGSAMIEVCPANARAGLDMWDDLGPALEIARRMKQQFDPRHTLSPGRFAGRI